MDLKDHKVTIPVKDYEELMSQYKSDLKDLVKVPDKDKELAYMIASYVKNKGGIVPPNAPSIDVYIKVNW